MDNLSKQTNNTNVDINASDLWDFTWKYIKNIGDTLREPFLILDENLKVLSANKMFYSAFQVTAAETEGVYIYDLGNGQWNIPQLRTLLRDILPNNSFFEEFKVVHDFPVLGEKIMFLNARRLYKPGEKRPLVILAIEDVTVKVQLEEQLESYTKKLAFEVAEKTAALHLRVKELERVNKLMVGRELKMKELKTELKKLKKSR